MRFLAIKERAQKLRDCEFLIKLRLAVGDKKNAKCIAKPNLVLNEYTNENPNADFTIKAHHPSPTTSAPQPPTAAAATASSLAVDVKKEEQFPKLAVKGSKWSSIKDNLRLKIKNLLKKQPKAAIVPSAAAVAASSLSSPPAPLTISVPEPLQDHQTSPESPSDRVKRVASTAINNLGRAFTSCLPLSSFHTPKTPPSSTFSAQNILENNTQQAIPTTNNSSNTKKNPFQVVKSCIVSFKDSLVMKKNSNNNTEQTNNNNIFSATNFDDMMNSMIDTINTATGRKKEYKGIKVVKKMWKSTTTWAAGF
jgi:hypothetical protein